MNRPAPLAYPWDGAAYQRIAEASGEGHQLSVRFENGDQASFDVRRLIDTGDRAPDWSQLSSDGFELAFPVNGELAELPWIQIRTLIDQDLATHLARQAERESSQVGHRIRLLRERRGLSGRELAERAGIAPQSLSRIERGRHDVTFSKVQVLLAAMDYRLQDLSAIGTAEVEPERIRKALAESGLDTDTVERIFHGVDQPSALLRRARDIFGWSPTDLAGPGAPPSLATPALAGRFKELARERPRASSSYVSYAYYLATLVERSADCLPYSPLPETAEEFAAEACERRGSLDFEAVLGMLWDHGIPVLPLRDAAQFHGACWLIGERPVVVLKQRLTYNSRWAFDASHEALHVIRHLSAEQPAVVEFDEIGRSHAEEEREASEFAGDVLLGPDPHGLAERAASAAGGVGQRLKGVLPAFAEREGVELGALANYLAFRLSSEDHGSVFWGVAAKLQRGEQNAYGLAHDLLESRLEWGRLEGDERLILEGALDRGEEH